MHTAEDLSRIAITANGEARYLIWVCANGFENLVFMTDGSCRVGVGRRYYGFEERVKWRMRSGFLIDVRKEQDKKLFDEFIEESR